VNSAKRGPRERAPHTRAEQTLKRAEAERSNFDAVHALTERAQKIGWRRARIGADRQQEPDRLV
jgi:hypothetical protein